MEFEELFTGSRWAMLKELASKQMSETELASRLGTSLANISQQIRLLEAYGIVSKEKQVLEKKPGKPRKAYSLQKSFATISLVTENNVKKLAREITPIETIFLNTTLNTKNPDMLILLKHFITNEEIINRSQGIALLKAGEDEIELLIVTEKLEDIRKKYSNLSISAFGKEKKVVNWTHSLEEIKAGLERKEDYFVQIVKKMIPIHDTGGIFKKIEVMKNEQVR